MECAILPLLNANMLGAVVAACEAIWLKRILKDLGVPIQDPTPLYCNNLSSIYLARNPVFHATDKAHRGALSLHS